MPARKNREPSKCREWERDRRNRLNEAFTQLSALLAEHATEQPPPGKGHANLSKMEIIQRAIVFLKELIQQKSQLDAKLLAAQAELKGCKVASSNKKDVSTQINRQLQHNTAGGPKKKFIWRETARKEKRIAPSLKEVTKQEIWKPSTAPHVKLPKLLPKSMTSEKDVLEKRVVVLPATPYILPHRPLVLPQAAPTFFVLEPFPSATRNSLPIIPRVVSEITKTTMVNNIPIAAYSFPLSLAKSKKNKQRDKAAVGKHSVSRKRQLKVVKKSKKMLNKSVNGSEIQTVKDSTDTKALNACTVKADSGVHNLVDSCSQKQTVNSPPKAECSKTTKLQITENPDVIHKLPMNQPETNEEPNSKSVTENTKLQTEINDNENFDDTSVGAKLHQACSETNKMTNNKLTTEPENKSKDKIQSLLDTSMCDNTVDGGNARLELAEEFLAASPTAAFLMTFPLVSGVRADSPADDEQHTLQAVAGAAPRPAPAPHKRAPSMEVSSMDTFFEKSSEMGKPLKKNNANIPTSLTLFNDKSKLSEKQSSSNLTCTSQSLAVTSSSVVEPSFLNLLPPVPCAAAVATDTVFTLDFDGNSNKNTSSSISYVNNNNFLFKNDTFNGKSNNLNMYPSNNLSTGHEYNSFGLYPCAVEKYSNKINKAEYLNTDENFMKMGPARLPYDLDLSLSQKPYEFISNPSVNLSKENVFTPATTFPCSSYNPFNPDFHVQLTTSSGNNSTVKKGNVKSNPFYTDTISNLYSQPSTLWPEEFNLYGNNTVNVSKTSNVKPPQSNTFSNQIALTTNKNTKNIQNYNTNISKPSKLEVNQLITDKNNKKSPSKAHINWMTSEVRPLQNNHLDVLHNENKDQTRIQFPSASNNALLPHLDYNTCKKFDYMETNFFPISMPNITSHTNQEDVQLWPSSRTLTTAEIGLEPPPINLPTLVGDLALGPHERRKSVDRASRGNLHPELPSCNNFLSVTQLMNRSNEASTGRAQTSNESHKIAPAKNEYPFTYPAASMDKPALSHIDANNMQPCYFLNDSKPNNTLGTIPYNTGQTRHKNHKMSEKSKPYKNNYSAEALLKGANNVHKFPDNFATLKFTNASQKYSAYNSAQESQAAQVSHFPSIADYPDASYSQPYAGSGLYTSTAGGSLYGNFMAGGGGGSGGGVSGAYAPANFTPDYVDFGPAPDCNFTYPRFDNFKIKNPPDTSSAIRFPLDLPKTTQKDTAAKHKTEHSKKDPSKKFQSKRPKMSGEIEWTEASETSLHSKQAKRSSYNMSEELTFSNYLMNQGPVYSHHALEPTLGPAPPAAAPPGAAAAASRPAALCPANVARTNFNLSTLFPEIAKKVQ